MLLVLLVQQDLTEKLVLQVQLDLLDLLDLLDQSDLGNRFVRLECPTQIYTGTGIWCSTDSKYR